MLLAVRMTDGRSDEDPTRRLWQLLERSHRQLEGGVDVYHERPFKLVARSQVDVGWATVIEDSRIVDETVEAILFVVGNHLILKVADALFGGQVMAECLYGEILALSSLFNKVNSLLDSIRVPSMNTDATTRGSCLG